MVVRSPERLGNNPNKLISKEVRVADFFGSEILAFGWNIQQATMTITAQEGDGFTEYIATINTPLSGRRFQQFLNKPVYFPSSIGGIDADWKLPDQAEDPAYSEEIKKLLAIHQNDPHLQESFAVFLSHRKKLL